MESHNQLDVTHSIGVVTWSDVIDDSLSPVDVRVVGFALWVTASPIDEAKASLLESFL